MAYKYPGVAPTSNTLWNDDPNNKIINYAEQVKDAEIDWNDNSERYNGSYPNPDYDPEDPESPETIPYIPASFKTEDNKFQSKLNEFFLNHWADWQAFLNEKDLDPSTINTWKELEEFLAGIEDSEAYTLLSMLEYLEQQSGHLYIGMSDDVPGMLQATATTSAISIVGSHIDEETGIIKMVYSIG